MMKIDKLGNELFFLRSEFLPLYYLFNEIGHKTQTYDNVSCNSTIKVYNVTSGQVIQDVHVV